MMCHFGVDIATGTQIANTPVTLPLTISFTLRLTEISNSPMSTISTPNRTPTLNPMETNNRTTTPTFRSHSACDLEPVLPKIAAPSKSLAFGTAEGLTDDSGVNRRVKSCLSTIGISMSNMRRGWPVFPSHRDTTGHPSCNRVALSASLVTTTETAPQFMSGGGAAW